MNAHLRQYVEAVNALLREGTDLKTILKNLHIALKARGHEKLYAAVLRSMIRTYPALASNQRPVLIVAKEADAASFAADLKLKDPEVKIDPSIVGGYILTESGRRQDHSYKSRLLTWYKKAVGGR